MKKWCLPLLLTVLLFRPACAPPSASLGQWDALFTQELLFLQQGLRQHDIKGTYTVYFALPESDSQDCFAQKLLIEGSDGLWWERFTYTYDAQRDWYTFTGAFEPILLPPTARAECAAADREEKEAFRAASVKSAALCADADIDASLRFDVPSGPVTYCRRQEGAVWESGMETYTYLYQDSRLDFTAQIVYPQFAAGALPRAEEVNDRLQDAFFYGYPYDQTTGWNPTELLYGEIQRTFQATRWDGRYLSLCVYEYNDFRQANHPNEWYVGLTIDTDTGAVLTLSDILGSAGDLADTLAPDAFRPLSPWDEDGGALSAVLRSAIEQNASERFCLTDSTIIFIENTPRCRRFEAPLSAVGLDRWLEVQPAAK